MNSKIVIDEAVLYSIFEQESRRIVGTCLKRIEIPMKLKEEAHQEIILNKEELENAKAQIKNILHESLRVLKSMIVMNGKESVRLTNRDTK